MHENKGNGCRNKLNQVRDRFKRLNIACWAICFFRVLHIIYASVLVISISLSLLFALLSSSVSVTLFSPLSFFHLSFSLLSHSHSSPFLLFIPLLSFILSLALPHYTFFFLLVLSTDHSENTHSDTYTGVNIHQHRHMARMRRHNQCFNSCHINMRFSVQLFYTNFENVR